MSQIAKVGPPASTSQVLDSRSVPDALSINLTRLGQRRKPLGAYWDHAPKRRAGAESCFLHLSGGCFTLFSGPAVFLGCRKPRPQNISAPGIHSHMEGAPFFSPVWKCLRTSLQAWVSQTILPVGERRVSTERAKSWSTNGVLRAYPCRFPERKMGSFQVSSALAPHWPLQRASCLRTIPRKSSLPSHPPKLTLSSTLLFCILFSIVCCLNMLYHILIQWTYVSLSRWSHHTTQGNLCNLQCFWSNWKSSLHSYPR